MKITQYKLIKNALIETGEVSRNKALRGFYGGRFITRLATIICDLKKEGVNINCKNDGGDFIYRLVQKDV